MEYVHAQPRKHAVPSYGVIVIGAPGGALGSIAALLRSLPEWFQVPVLIALTGAEEPHDGSALPLAGDGLAIPVREARAGQILEPGAAVVASPGSAFAVTGPGPLKQLAEVKGAVRGAGMDVLLWSAAEAFGSRTAAVILAGVAEGTEWAGAVRRAGGIVIAEDAGDRMVERVSSLGAVQAGANYVLPLSEIAPFLAHLVAV